MFRWWWVIDDWWSIVDYWWLIVGDCSLIIYRWWLMLVRLSGIIDDLSLMIVDCYFLFMTYYLWFVVYDLWWKIVIKLSFEFLFYQLDSATSLIQAAKNLMNAVVLTVKSSYVASTKYTRQGTIAVSLNSNFLH